jgi:hypothetical protein
MDHYQLVRAIAVGRVAVGASLIALPGVAGRQWIGDAASDRRTKVIIRAFGVRDLALGAGTLQALDTGQPARPWVVMGAVSDVVDLAATAVAIRALGARRAVPVMLVAAGAAIGGLLASEHVD